MSETQERTERVQISISGIRADLASGLTRLDGDSRYNAELGSVQSKYSLTKGEVKEIFKHPKLKGLTTKVPSRVQLIDDEEGEVASTPKFGEPSPTAVERMLKNADSAEIPSGEVPEPENVSVQEEGVDAINEGAVSSN